VRAASADTSIIREWWTKWPRANIGIATGSVTNLIVIDLDERHGGIESWKKWEKENPTKTSLIVKSGGGFHLYFDAQGHKIKSRTNILPGIDVRAEGAYIVAAGSMHHSGVPYSWVCDETNVPSPLSDDLRRLLVGDLSTPFSFSPSLRSGENENSARDDESCIVEGSRNDFLTRIAGVLRREACTSTIIGRTLAAVNDAICSPRLEVMEVHKIAQGKGFSPPSWVRYAHPMVVDLMDFCRGFRF
jgi:putative DNA primase/helicase